MEHIAACLSHAALLSKPSVIESSDIVLGFTGLYFITGVKTLIDATLKGATRIVNTGPFSPERFFELVKRFKATYILSTPVVAFQLVNNPEIERVDLSSLKHFIAIGCRMSFDLMQQFTKYFQSNDVFCHGYGMTELGGPISRNLYHMRNNCAGQLAEGCQAKIIDENGQCLGPNECGELCIKKQFVFSGYINDPRSTADYFDNEGFLYTGDIGYFDDNGDLFIVDRKKLLFDYGGQTVTPCEIEEYIEKVDGVQMSCVVPTLDANGNVVAAAVVVKVRNSNCTETDIFNFISGKAQLYLQASILFVMAFSH